MAKPAVILVSADESGVGKTTVARTLLDYFTTSRVPIRAFDTSATRSLERFHPDITDVIDIRKRADQRAIVATVGSIHAAVTLLDVRTGLMTKTLQALRDSGLIDAAINRSLTFAVFQVLGPSIASLDELIDTASDFHGAHYFLVRNENNAPRFLDRYEPASHPCFDLIKQAVEINFPKLNEMAAEQVERASVPYLTFIANKKESGAAASYSFVMRGYVRHWLGHVFAEYDRIKLGEILAPHTWNVAQPVRIRG